MWILDRVGVEFVVETLRVPFVLRVHLEAKHEYLFDAHTQNNMNK